MGGSSDGGYSGRPSRPIRLTLSGAEINGCLRDLLRDYNDRDTQAISRHLQVLRDSLEIRDDDVIRTLFGGSVSKHTAVNGLSDVDVLVIVNDSSLSGQSPAAVIKQMAERIRQRLPQTKVSTGALAVTVKYSDGVEVQVLPAVRTKSGVRIADPGTDRWSSVLYPERFARKLTQINQANEGRVIPTVKLAKGLADHMIRSDRDKISGYHMESLAIEAFRNYQGSHDLKSTLRHFLDHSSRAVLKPITDPTGQSRHVDEDLGSANSERRQRASEAFRRMMRRFDDCNSRQDFDNLFGL